jgi:hypothetical protein
VRWLKNVAELYVLDLVDDTYPAAAEFLDDAMVRNRLAGHSGDARLSTRFVLRMRHRPVNEWVHLFS